MGDFRGQVWMRVDFAEATVISIYLGRISKVDCFYDTLQRQQTNFNKWDGVSHTMGCAAEEDLPGYYKSTTQLSGNNY